MRRIHRLVKFAEKNVKRTWREFIADTVTTTFFWLVVHALKDIFIVRMTTWQIIVAAGTGMILNLSLGGVCGQVMNFARRLVGCRKK